MARARNIKPSFFKNEDLALCEHGARLVFVGLWTIADREGRLEDRPLRIKAELFPYENCDIEKWLSQLADRRFIFRYSDAGRKFIQVLNFKKHQSPHVKESESTIPAPDAHQLSTMLAHLNPESLLLNPESGILNPHYSDHGSPVGESGASTMQAPCKPRPVPDKPKQPRCRKPEPNGFSEWYDAYPRHVGRAAAAAAYETAVMAFMVKDHLDRSAAVETLLAITKTFASSVVGRLGSKTPHPVTWLHHARYFDDQSEWNHIATNGTHAKPRLTIDDALKGI